MIRAALIFPLLVTIAFSVPIRADQFAPFHDPLANAASIADNGGVITGWVGFAPAVNGSGAVFTSRGNITYANSVFAANSGSISFWFNKFSSDDSGGIAQLGTLGQANSLGIFYLNTTDIFFEARNAAGDLGQLSVTGVLPSGTWTHVAATWDSTTDGTRLILFINGRAVGNTLLPGSFNHVSTTLDFGTTGYYEYAEGMADELRFFDWSLIYEEAYAEYVTSSNRHRPQASAKPPSTGPVRFEGKTLYVDDEPFLVKGVGYAPTPIGYWPGDWPVYLDPAILARDVPLLENLHVNTVRTWAQPPNNTLLNALYYDADPPIHTLIGFWIPQDGMDDYGDPATIALHESRFRDLVNQFKNHPGLLGWLIGNEVNLGLGGQPLADFYALVDHLAQVAYEGEGATYHPCIVVNGGMWGMGNVDFNSDDISLPYLDAWGHNTYFGKYARRYFDYYDAMTAKPLIFTEYGIDAFNNLIGQEYQDVHAEYVVRQWRQISARCAGASLMAYSDEWWKADAPSSHDPGGYATGMHPDGFSNEEWWGLLSAQNNGSNPDILHPRAAYYALAAEFHNPLGDVDADGDVDLADLAELLARYDTCDGDSAYAYPADLDADGRVTLSDLAALLANYGRTVE